MRQIYTSPRMANIERVVALLAEHGIQTSIGNRRAYQGADWKRFSYTAKGDRDSWPQVMVTRADDQPLARRLLREAGLEPATRFIGGNVDVADRLAEHVAHADGDFIVGDRFAAGHRVRVPGVGRVEQCGGANGADITRIDERPFTRAERPGDDVLLGDCRSELQQILHIEGGTQVGYPHSAGLGAALDLPEPAQRAGTTQAGIRTDT